MFEEILNVYVPKLDTGFIVLEHDLYQQTVDLAIGYVLPMAISSGKFKLMSIINCMGVPGGSLIDDQETVYAMLISLCRLPSVH